MLGCQSLLSHLDICIRQQAENGAFPYVIDPHQHDGPVPSFVVTDELLNGLGWQSLPDLMDRESRTGVFRVVWNWP